MIASNFLLNKAAAVDCLEWFLCKWCQNIGGLLIQVSEGVSDSTNGVGLTDSWSSQRHIRALKNFEKQGTDKVAIHNCNEEMIIKIHVKA